MYTIVFKYYLLNTHSNHIMLQTRRTDYTFKGQKCQVINAENKDQPEAIVIFLHGRGDTAKAFREAIKMLFEALSFSFLKNFDLGQCWAVP